MPRRRTSEVDAVTRPASRHATRADDAGGDWQSHRGWPAAPIRVGVGGWTFAPWRDNFYPSGLPQRRELEFASRHLSAIEVNGTFYRAQKPETYRQWREQTPPGFVFSLKAPMSITQRGALATKGGPVARFVEGLAHLGDRLGPILWQFEPTRAFDPDDLEAFASLLPRETGGIGLRHVFELRNRAAVQPAYLALARRHRIATVFTDSTEYPSFADLTGDFAYARLMRSRSEIDTGYPAHELDAWAARARTWATGGEPDDLPRAGGASPPAAARDVFVYFISAAKERNPAAAQALLARL
jgi:uncharacterized protein YecE (DUF72 family)